MAPCNGPIHPLVLARDAFHTRPVTPPVPLCVRSGTAVAALVPVLLFTVALVAAPAVAHGEDRASAETAAAPAQPIQRQTFWQRIVDPHGPEIAAVLHHAGELHQRARRLDAGVDHHDTRRRLLDDARGMLRHALRLSPDHLEVIALLADVHDAAGRSTAAIAGYRRYMERTDDKDLSRARCLRFGVLLARVGHMRDAAAVLHRCVDLPYLPHIELRERYRSRAIAALAMVLAHDDRLDDAFALIHRNLEAERDHMVAFTLAVLYDQDEQITRAYEILEHDFDAMSDGVVFQAVAEGLLEQPFVPAAERHYYYALLYESRGLLIEARAEWLAYVHGSALTRYHERAHKHVRAVDRLLDERTRKPVRPEPPSPLRIIRPRPAP